MPIFEGYAIPYAVVSLPIAGQHLSKILYNNFVTKPGFMSNHQNDEMFIFDIDIARTVKEAYCSIPLEYDA